MHQVRLLMRNYSKTLRTARNITAVNTVGLCCLSPEQTELFTSPLSCSASYHHFSCGMCKYRANNVLKCFIFTRTVKYDWTSNINYYLKHVLQQHNVNENYSVHIDSTNVRHKPRFTNASDHEQFGLRTNFPNTKRLGWRTVSRVTNTQAVNIVER